MKKTGLYFGSFNPIHIGHTAIANYLLEYTDLRELWFVVSPHNPLKKKSSLLKDHFRYDLLEKAVKPYPRFRICDIEFRMPKPSYTINTLTYLSERYPDNLFVLIMGSDCLPTFHKWKNYLEILRFYHIIVYLRPNYPPGDWEKHESITIVNAPQMEISSSFIRSSIKEGKEIPFFMPAEAYKYMRDMHFYEK